MTIKKLRILYALGPGDIVAAYSSWKTGEDISSEMSIPFSFTFLDWCERAGAQAHLISWNSNRKRITDGDHIIENRPKPSWYWTAGIKHHLGSAAYGLSILATVTRDRPDILIIDSGTMHWLLASLPALARIPVIAVMHSTLWPSGFPSTRPLDRLLRRLDGIFFQHAAAASISVSPECERQIRKIAPVPNGPLLQCRAQFRRGFLDLPGTVPLPGKSPFKVLFVGRIEEHKGVFFILALAEELEKQAPGKFRWSIVGSGSALEELKRQAGRRNLSDVVEITGPLSRDQVQAAYASAHSVVVPTMPTYNEGLAMTAAEAVLAGRPVVLSSVVPAWEVLGDAAIRVAPDDLAGFVSAFRRLAFDADYYESRRSATASVQSQFYDSTQSLGAVIGRVIPDLIGRDGHA